MLAAALVHGGCAAFAPQQHPLGASPRVTRARPPLLCAADDRCGAISLAEVGEVAERLGCKLAVNSMGPGYKLELLWGDEMAGQMIGGDPSRPELLGASDGFTQPTGVAHLETIQLRRFTGYWRRSWSRRYDEVPKLDRSGLGLLLSAGVAAWIVENDPFGVQEVQGKRASALNMPSASEEGAAPRHLRRREAAQDARTLMEMDLYDFLRKWADTVRGMQPSVSRGGRVTPPLATSDASTE